MARGIGKAIRCDGCDTTLLDYHGRMVSPDSVLCDSIVYGAGNVVLCKKCSRFEHDEEEIYGTNLLPHLLRYYKTPK